MRAYSNDRSDYEDILSLPHPVSAVHPPMDRLTRAAQFAPFAALTGYHEAVHETARLTEDRIELDEMEKAVLDTQLQKLWREKENPKIGITCFCPDERKAGGKYVEITGVLRKVDPYERRVILQDGRSVPIDEIIHIDGVVL
ncbi:MAG: hypothetical protein KH452_02675 [Clostridiales bacterium]|nr:hypothetical protein [Clostridiales bacterium]